MQMHDTIPCLLNVRLEMSPSFPQEFVNTIINFLHDKTSSLYACSLVCHNWLETSRIHKFLSCTVSKQQPLNECSVSVPHLRNILLAGYFPTLPFDSTNRPLRSHVENKGRQSGHDTCLVLQAQPNGIKAQLQNRTVGVGWLPKRAKLNTSIQCFGVA